MQHHGPRPLQYRGAVQHTALHRCIGTYSAFVASVLLRFPSLHTPHYRSFAHRRRLVRGPYRAAPEPAGTSPRQDSGRHCRRSGVTVGCTNGHTPRPRQRPTTHSSPAPCASRHSSGLDASSAAVRCSAASRPPGPIQHHGPPGPCSTGAMQLRAYTASWPPGPMQHGCYAASHPVAAHR